MHTFQHVSPLCTVGKIPGPVSHLGSALIPPTAWHHNRPTRPSSAVQNLRALLDSPAVII